MASRIAIRVTPPERDCAGATSSASQCPPMYRTKQGVQWHLSAPRYPRQRLTMPRASVAVGRTPSCLWASKVPQAAYPTRNRTDSAAGADQVCAPEFPTYVLLSWLVSVLAFMLARMACWRLGSRRVTVVRSQPNLTNINKHQSVAEIWGNKY